MDKHNPTEPATQQRHASQTSAGREARGEEERTVWSTGGLALNATLHACALPAGKAVFCASADVDVVLSRVAARAAAVAAQAAELVDGQDRVAVANVLCSMVG